MLKMMARNILYPMLTCDTLLVLPLILVAFPFCILVELATKGSFTKEDLEDYLTASREYITYPWQIFGE